MLGEKVKTIISIDCMGGDLGEQEVLKGIVKAYSKNKSLFFLIHGVGNKMPELLKKQKRLSGAFKFIPANHVVSMHEKPSQALRNGKNTSMWQSLESVANGDAKVAVSCGNTGALMAMSMVRLRKIEGVNRPAIAVLWPSTNPHGFNIVLDAGADIRADAQDLHQYALMGISYAESGFNIRKPRVGLLNVGTEDHKGRSELQKAAELILESSKIYDFEYVGYVEGDDIPSSKIDVVVTDGFTGNIALKTGEGTATLVRTLLKETFAYSIMAKLAAFLALKPLRTLRKRIDPRRVNGGVFLGLNGTIVKSHGSADATGISAAITLAYELTKNDFQKNVAGRILSHKNIVD
tara:strand:- start:435 stop:1481 length:1047 start_codon:yes stop_codon:yes gene_type:complete